MQERRMDARLLCADLVELIWSDFSGEEKRRIGNLEDISACGMSIQVETAIHVGTHMRILCGERELTGIVRYALYRDDSYFIGVQLDENSRWSVRHFVPQHILDPRQIIDRPAHMTLNSLGSNMIH